MSTTTHIEVRRPEFLERALGKSGVEPAPFLGATSGPKLRAVPTPVPPSSQTTVIPQAPALPPAPVVSMAEVEARMRAEVTTRIGAAIDLLRVHGERLAAEVRIDALEIAFVLARKIIDTELSQSVEPLVGIVRTAVRRLGESRRIVVRLSPHDADALAAESAARGTSVMGGIASVQIDVVADPTLGRGDCVVDGDFGSVDGRLGNRLEELRRSVLATIGPMPTAEEQDQ